MDEKVFISYSRKDSDWADKIKTALESNGISCWMDRAGISAGGRYTREIIDAIKRCQVFLLVLSPNAEQSEWVPKELGMAIQYRKYIIPMKITNFQIEEFELQLENIQIFDVSGLSGGKVQTNLVNTVKSVLQSNTDTVTEGNPSAPGGQSQKISPASVQEPKTKKDIKKIGAICAGAAIVIFFLIAGLGRSSQEPDAGETVNAAVSSSAEESDNNDSSKASQLADNETEEAAVSGEDGEASQEKGESENGSSSQESVDELMGYIDQSQELLLKLAEDFESISSEEVSADIFRKYVEVSENVQPDLVKLQEQARAVKGLDPKLKTAGDEYFNLICDLQKAICETMGFLADHFEIRNIFLLSRPKAEDYGSKKEYYNELKTWYGPAKEAYEAVDSCPAFLETEWKKYGEILDLNESIVNKLNWAAYYEDGLRYMSALNMSERYNTVEKMKSLDFLNSLQEENNHSIWQGSVSDSLLEEIRAYVRMEEEERRAYEFKNIIPGELSLDYDVIDTIYPSLYNSYDAFVVIKTGCVSGSRKVVVEAEIPGFTQKYKEVFTLDSAYRTIRIKPPALTGELDLSAAKSGQVRVTISEIDGTLIDDKTFAVTLKSKYDFDWYSDEYGISTKDNILCFLTPESESITRLKRQAIDKISAITGGRIKSFAGYQNTAYDNHYISTYAHAAGIMMVLHDMGVRYTMDTFSISGSNQHILFPEEVLELKSGLCIETSLVVASALQSAGMHVFLVFPPNHAQVAVEVWNGRGDDKSGTGKYFLIETTAVANDYENVFIEGIKSLQDGKKPAGPITYYNQEEWEAYLSKENTYLIDCDDSRILGMTPFAN